MQKTFVRLLVLNRAPDRFYATLPRMNLQSHENQEKVNSLIFTRKEKDASVLVSKMIISNEGYTRGSR